MQPKIKTSTEKKLIGIRIRMSLLNNKTGDLWKNFMSRRKEIQNNKGTDLYSMQVYHLAYFHLFNPAMEFEKWATIEVTDFDTIPEGMEPFTLTGGLYAVFDYKGLNTDTRIFEYIFTDWLPNSDYILDDRPHFEILGAKYKNNDPDSEEEIWVPIKEKENGAKLIDRAGFIV